MLNEILYLFAGLLDLVMILLMLRVGKPALMSIFLVNIILVSTFGAKLIPLFGFVTNVTNVFYAISFVTMNVIFELYGIKDSFKAMWSGFAGLVIFIIMGQFVIRIDSIAQSAAFSNNVQSIFQLVPRIAFASMIAYLLSQSLNIYSYNWFKNRFPNTGIWGRNLGSAVVSQAIDSVFFFTIAFAGTMPLPLLAQTIALGFCVKVIFSIIGTPFIYASRFVKMT